VLDRAAGVLPAIRERRHRESLRGIVQRVVAATARLDPRRDATLRSELARTIDLAVVATTAVDELERGLVGADLRDPDGDLRRRLRERDRHASTLLDLAAFLDAFRASQAARRSSGGDGE